MGSILSYALDFVRPMLVKVNARQLIPRLWRIQQPSLIVPTIPGERIDHAFSVSIQHSPGSFLTNFVAAAPQIFDFPFLVIAAVPIEGVYLTIRISIQYAPRSSLSNPAIPISKVTDHPSLVVTLIPYKRIGIAFLISVQHPTRSLLRASIIQFAK